MKKFSINDLKTGSIPILHPILQHSNDGFHAEEFSKLYEAEGKHFWFNVRNRYILRSINQFFPNAKNLLEIGCGTGFVLQKIAQTLPNLELFGSDVHTAGLQFAQQRLQTHAKFFQMDAREIPFDQELDLIGMFDVLEHITEDNKVLEQIYHALKPGGGIILTVPQHNWLWSNQDTLACHKRRYAKNELKQKLQQANFTVLKKYSFNSILIPLIYLKRCLLDQQRRMPNDELSLPKMLNNTFKATMMLEYYLSSIGITLPIGCSQMIVAKKS